MHFLWDSEPTFVKCLESLPNLHTIEIGIGLMYGRPRTALLREALQRVKLPQIKTLTLPPAAHPLLKHCPNAEDVDWLIGDDVKVSDEILGSLPNRDSKIKRLTIPLVLSENPSRKWSSTLWDHTTIMVTDSPRSQDLWPSVQSSSNSPSSTHTPTATYTHTVMAHVTGKK